MYIEYWFRGHRFCDLILVTTLAFAGAASSRSLCCIDVTQIQVIVVLAA